MKKRLLFIMFSLPVIAGISTSQAANLSYNRSGNSPDLFIAGSADTDSSPDDTIYSFIVAGHAYGAHQGGNIGLHPALLNSLNSGFDSTAAFIVFTGDIVNQSTTQSWQQVENELATYGLPYYFVMGNHDNNDIGRQVFNEKYGGTHYAFLWQRDLFIVLNSPEGDRCITPDQLTFLTEQISQVGDSTRKIFIFFHEVLWNSNEKYIGVRSNSRSRYDQITGHSNYWEEVHPLLTANPGKQFYVIAGDVGGNTDAVAAFYDKWDNVTLLASGMGEVPDENYLLVKVHSRDSVTFELVPLNPDLILPGIEYYSVPPAPDSIAGPGEVTPGDIGVEYSVPEVFNATFYFWELPAGMTGSDTSSHLIADVDSGFTEGMIAVRAERDGFGQGPAVSKTITAKTSSVNIRNAENDLVPVEFFQTGDQLVIIMNGLEGKEVTVRIYDFTGRLMKMEQENIREEVLYLKISENALPEGLVFVSVSVGCLQIARRLIIIQDR